MLSDIIQLKLEIIYQNLFSHKAKVFNKKKKIFVAMIEIFDLV